jgi:glucose/arabinose dehydrogenase
VGLTAGPLAAQPSIEPVARDLAFPTNMAFAPDGRILFTEKNHSRLRAWDKPLTCSSLSV